MSSGLPPRPEIPASEMAAVTVAVSALVSSGVTTDDKQVVTPPWRFSGRWFASSPLNDQRRP
ncbi:MAG: hypothetical protein KJS64_06290 [Acidobacteria bacterium]|nr:hypothetical protein [Acidobacteriota bacterium]